MRSSSGQYYIGLDHLRAFAAFLVFCWHFIHAGSGQLAGAPAFPLSLFAEGHTGVALFMTLSGYLMAKLIDGKSVHFGWFLYNRLLRLLPLLALVLAAVWLLPPLETGYGKMLLQGFVLPVWPNGGWSIAVELHFYLLLPLFLWASRKSPWALPVFVMAAMALRLAIYTERGEVQSLAYWTLVGRIDQFLLGMIAYHHRRLVAGKHAVMALLAIGFLVFYRWFDQLGGFYTAPSYPSPHPVWVVLSTLEGVFYASLIAWYDALSQGMKGRAAKALALVGRCSYSIYLLHFFVVFRVSQWLHAQVVALDNLYLAMLLSIPAFALLVPFAYVSFRFIESPFLKLRKGYLR